MFISHQRIRACALASFVFAFASDVDAQQMTCQSRLVEQTLQRAIQDRYGPTAFSQLQAIAGGQAVPMRVNLTNVETLGDSPGGWSGLICSASANFWRGDTGQTISVTAEFWLLDAPGGEAKIQVKRWTP